MDGWFIRSRVRLVNTFTNKKKHLGAECVDSFTSMKAVWLHSIQSATKGHYGQETATELFSSCLSLREDGGGYWPIMIGTGNLGTCINTFGGENLMTT